MDITWILDKKLAVSATPFSREDLLKWKKQGVNAVLNLLEEHEKVVLDEDYLELKFDYLNFPIRDMDAPNLKELYEIVKWIDKKINEGKIVLVHCYAGLGRSGIVVAAYVIYKFGYKPEEAVKFVRERRPGAVQSFSQFIALESFYRYLNSKMR